MPHVDSQRRDDELALTLNGRWDAAALRDIDAELEGLDLDGVRRVRIGGDAQIDLSGAWALHRLCERLRAQQIAPEFEGGVPDAMRVVGKALQDRRRKPRAEGAPTIDEEEEPAFNPVEALGRSTVERLRAMADGLEFLGRIFYVAVRAFGSLRRLRPISVARHIYDTGITAIPIVSLIAFLISIIIAYLSAGQLQDFGADIFVVDLITVGVLRELGVLLTAIIVAGRSGSAFAAEIGAMKLNEEVDALVATGVDPVETLVLPRVVGLVIALPLLTFIADIVGMTGGALLCYSLLDMPLQQFINRAQEAISPTTFWVGIWKAPVFAMLIAMVGTFRGMQVRGSSRELGRLTTVAVVQAIFLVLLADALFAILFMELDV
jgi:phospholipid/cholesterol/gamma-HCH transport system permease protein